MRRWHQLWVPHLRRQWIGQILPEPGATAIGDANDERDANDDASSNIRRALQRAPNFSASTIDNVEADQLVGSHIMPMGGEPIMPPDTAAVRTALRKVRDTAAGPDGLPYSAWRPGGN